METNIIQYNQWELPTLNANSKAILFNTMQCGNASWHLRYVQCSQCLLWLEGANVFPWKPRLSSETHTAPTTTVSALLAAISAAILGVQLAIQAIVHVRHAQGQEPQIASRINATWDLYEPVNESNNPTRTTRARSPTRKHHKYYKCYQYYKLTSQQTNFKEGKSLFWNQLSSLGLCDICSIGLLVTWPQDDGTWWHVAKKTGNLSEKSIVLSLHLREISSGAKGKLNKRLGR